MVRSDRGKKTTTIKIQPPPPPPQKKKKKKKWGRGRERKKKRKKKRLLPSEKTFNSRAACCSTLVIVLWASPTDPSNVPVCLRHWWVEFAHFLLTGRAVLRLWLTGFAPHPCPFTPSTLSFPPGEGRCDQYAVGVIPCCAWDATL